MLPFPVSSCSPAGPGHRHWCPTFCWSGFCLLILSALTDSRTLIHSSEVRHTTRNECFRTRYGFTRTSHRGLSFLITSECFHSDGQNLFSHFILASAASQFVQTPTEQSDRWLIFIRRRRAAWFKLQIFYHKSFLNSGEYSFNQLWWGGDPPQKINK